jgi:hypothetical protein
MLAVTTNGLPPFATCFTSLFWGEFVSIAAEMSDFSSASRDLALLGRIHSGKPTRPFLGCFLYLCHGSSSLEYVLSEM